jgi:hypothetical protein
VMGPNHPARIAPPEHCYVFIRITLDVVALEKHRKAREPRNQKGKVEGGGKVLKQPQAKLIGKDLNSLQLQDSQIGMYLSHRSCYRITVTLTCPGWSPFMRHRPILIVQVLLTCIAKKRNRSHAITLQAMCSIKYQ